ncbi:20423_t:CDS:1 [Dentiscutata erythropus]|uniref:20423_t:CDS:1 n=1 Tax=Dentiscutata erythropus TaxID=1348616 RepID=A0A9N9IRF6_9GLOM|nr:20423_t:CDS:1 [Dentiscutata erythropus]
MSKNLTLCNEHKSFRLELVRALINDATINPLKRTTRSEGQSQVEKEAENKKARVFENFKLPLSRFVGNDHFPEYNERRACLWCRYIRKKENKPALQNPPQSNIWCSKCDVALCCNKERSCFKDFHTLED